VVKGKKTRVKRIVKSVKMYQSRPAGAEFLTRNSSKAHGFLDIWGGGSSRRVRHGARPIMYVSCGNREALSCFLAFGEWKKNSKDFELQKKG